MLRAAPSAATNASAAALGEQKRKPTPGAEAKNASESNGAGLRVLSHTMKSDTVHGFHVRRYGCPRAAAANLRPVLQRRTTALSDRLLLTYRLWSGWAGPPPDSDLAKAEQVYVCSGLTRAGCLSTLACYRL